MLKLALIALVLLVIPGAPHERPHRVLDGGSRPAAARPHVPYRPVVVQPAVPAVRPTPSHRVVSEWLVTAYCIDGTTASGQRTRPGIVAAGSWLPFGARIELRIGDAWQTVVVEDRGSDVHGRHLDLWMTSCAAAVDWGVREVPGWVSVSATPT